MAKEYELTLNMIQLQLENDNKDLDFSKNYNLVRIMAFSSLMPAQKTSIRSINLDNNKLDNIERIDFLSNLEYLSVNNNIIKEIHLQIISLKELRLSQNQLRQIPSLASLQNLKTLDLSHNKITSMEDKQIQELPDSIEKFYINNNQIRYKDGYGIIQTIEEFHKKGALIELNIAKNPFIIKFPFIEKTFARKLPQIDLLNGKARNFILKGEEGGEQQVDDLENLEFENSEFEDVDDNRVSYELRKRIQTCIDDPSVAVSQLKKISETVSRITQQTPQQINNCFVSTSQKTQSEIEENMEVFLQASFLFAQNQPNYVEEVLKYLAQLAIVSVLQFGRRCFEVVVELIRSGSGLQKIASNILKTYSLPLLIKQDTLSKVPTFVMEGILRTIQERQDYSIVNQEAVNTFVKWLDQILHTYSNDTSSIREEQEQRDILCLQFIAEMAKEKKYFWNQYREKLIITKCIQLFKLLIDTEHNEQYIATLQILNNCSKQFKHEKFVTQTHRRSTNYNVKELIDSRNTAHNFMKYLEDQLRYHLFMFKKYRNSLINPETKENKDTIMVRYRKVEILFTIYGSVCMNRIYKDDTDRTQTKAEAQIVQKDFLINELLSLVIVPAIHPYLVNGLCIFARCLLYNNTVVIDDKLVKYISYKMQNCVPLLQYLGGDYYAPMMKQVEYQQSKFTKNMNAQLNPRIHKTFRNIVKLIKFFSQSALQEESPISGICLEIADSLDKNRRDEALFILLATPNDKVRLAVVQCLLTIKVSELDTREVAKLVTLIGSYKNLGAGKTETVLSHIMMILTKIVSTRDSGDKEIPAAQQDFITIYGENATLDALDILIRNQERNLLDEEAENKEKLELSFGVVNFLKSLHKSEKLSRNLKGILQAKSLKKSLLDEEAYIREELLDIDIERSYIGKWSSYLFSCLFSKDSLYPYGKISDRILIRMAENLENRKEDDPEELKNGKLGGLYNYDEIQRIWLEIALNRRKYQEQIWDAMKVLDFQNPPKTDEIKKYLDEQHNLFYQQECAVQLLGYLFGKNQSTRTMTLREHFEQMFQNKLNFDRVQNQVDGQIGDLIDDFIQFYQHGVQEKMLKIHNRNEDFDQILKNVPMPTDPMRGFLKTYSYFNPNKVILFPVKTKDDQSTVVQNALNRDEQLYGKVKQMIKPEKRIVTVCAYLRILHAQLEYSPNQMGPKVAEQLAQKTEFIKDLTLICEWADWRQGNIAAKYLRIINYILENAESCEQKEFMNAFFMIAYALRQILDIISLKLANEDKVPIKDEDLVLIKEACECMNKVTDKIGTISYIEGIEAELNSRKELKNNDEAKNQAKFLVDAKIDEYLLQQIMPFHGFLIFIEILVWDMQQDDKLSNLKTKDKFQSKLKTDMKNNIMELMSSYMTKCKSQKHLILSAINRMQVFDKKIIRQSFLQDILDQEFLIDYGPKLRQGIIDKEYMKYALLKPPGAPLKIDYNIRCFLQYKGDLVPVALIFMNGFLLVIRVEEELVRRKPKIAKIWQDDHFQLIFRVFDRLIQIQQEQIFGFFRGECPQRYYMVFTQKTMLTDPERDHTLEVFFFTFPRLHQYKAFESFLQSGETPIKLSNDQLIQSCIKKSLKNIDPLCMMWVCLDPKIPIMNRRDEFMRNAMLLVNDGKDIKIFRTNLEYWFFKEGFVIPTTISKRIQKHTDSVRKQMCEDGYFGTEVFNFALDKLQKIIIDQTLNCILTLQFGAKNELNILFGCDIAREEFKRSIAKPASIDKFKRSVKKK